MTSVTDTTRPGVRLREPVVAVAAVLLIAAVVFAAWSGWSWASAPRVSGHATARDAALRAGEQAVLNFNTLNYRHVGQGLALWEQSSTGLLREQIVADRTSFEQEVIKARTVTSAKILDAALTGLDVSSGRATIIAAVQITVTPAHGSAVTKQTRLAGTLVRTSSGWKLSALNQVPVSAASHGATHG